MGQAFVIGTDAPVAAVTSFAVQVESVIAVDSSGNQVLPVLHKSIDQLGMQLTYTF